MSLMPFDYEGQPVRAVELDGEWLVGTDVARALGYANPSDALTRVHPDDKREATLALSEGSRIVSRERTLINESGVYFLVLGSTLATARAFQRWITSEVLPAIRKTGQYGTAPALTEDEIVRQALAITHRDLEAARVTIAALEPKAEYVDRYVADDDLRILRNVAKSLGLKESALRQALLDHGWIYCETSSRWSEKRGEKVIQYRYSAYADHRAYFRPVPNHEAPRFKGEVDHTLKVTPAGAAAIERAARRWGLIPNTELEAVA